MGRMPGPWDTVLTLPHQTTRTRRKRGFCIEFGFQERGFCILIGLVQDSLQELQVSLFLFPFLFQGTTGDWVTHQVLRACARIAVLKNNILDIYRLSYCRWKSGVPVAPEHFYGKPKVGKMWTVHNRSVGIMWMKVGKLWNQRWEKCESFVFRPCRNIYLSVRYPSRSLPIGFSWRC